MCRTSKNESHFKKWVTIKKSRQTFKGKSYLKNESLLKK